MTNRPELTVGEVEFLALGLLLAMDFMADGKFDITIPVTAIQIADKLGIRPAWDKAVKQYPPMKITERYKITPTGENKKG